MKCKCNNIIPPGRVNLGFSVCTSCSTVESYGCAPLINHKTGNSIQIMSSSDAAKIAKMTQRRGYGTMLCQLLYTRGCASEQQAYGNVGTYRSKTETRVVGPKGNEFHETRQDPENDNRSLQAKNRQQYGRTKIEVGPIGNEVEPYLVI